MSQSDVIPIKLPMTAQEFRVEKQRLEAWIGPGQAKILAEIDGISHAKNDPPIRLAIYPRGVCMGSPLYVYAHNFDEAVVNVREAWTAAMVKQRSESTNDMALAIIKFTHQTGTCSEAQLRQEGFSDRNIRELGQDACKVATAMSGHAPFAITKTAKSNAA